MPLSKQEFYKLERHDTFYGFDMFRRPVVREVSEQNGQRIVSIQWSKDVPILCVWDEVTARVVTADGSQNRDVEGLNGQYACLWPETVSRLAEKWRDEGKLSAEDLERLLRAESQTSSHAMSIVMSSY